MATEPITASGGVSPSHDRRGSTVQKKQAGREPAGAAVGGAILQSQSDPPVDRIEVSNAARELARAVTDRQPSLQLSPQQLRTIATGNGGS